MVNDDFIKKHYSKVAKNFGETGLSTIQDPFIRDAEVDFFIREIEHYIIKEDKKSSEVKVVDLGCGNGFLLMKLRERFPSLQLYGLEFTPELHQIAQSREIPNCHIFEGDIRLHYDIFEQADICITERVLINLQSWKQQKSALAHIQQYLRPKGRLLMSESFLESWVIMNIARREVLLPELPQSKQNNYLSENTVKAIKGMGFREVEGQTQRHFLSTHFYITRVLHQIIRPEGAKIKHSHLVSFLNQALPPGVGTYSPIQFRVFLKGENEH